MSINNYADDYNLNELLAVAAARQIRDQEVILAGVGIPLVAALTAKYTHARNISILTEWGSVNPSPRRLMYCVSCTTVNERATHVTSQRNNLNDMQRGYVDLGIIGGAQVDKYGNVNSTLIGNVKNPKIALAGSGGANDIASSAKRTLIMLRDTKKAFVEKVDYNTSPGYIDGPGSREKYGLTGKGPAAVITAEGVFGFDEKTKEMYLESYHPGLNVKEIKDMIPWDLKVSPNVKETEPPTKEEVKIMRILDPFGVYLGNGRETLGKGEKGDFETFIRVMDESFSIMDKLIKGV